MPNFRIFSVYVENFSVSFNKLDKKVLLKGTFDILSTVYFLF